MSIQTIPRRLPEVGRLRLGQKLPAGNGTRPAALAAWRLTSKSRFRLEAAAQLYGGIVQEWKDAPGEDQQWELFTEAKALRVAVIPNQPVSQFYEHWTGGGCQRRCDGATELISGDPCLCRMEADEAADYRCNPTTRLSVLLPDLPGLGVWRVETHGYYGAAELAASAELLASFGRPMPVALVIDQRSEKRPGQPRRDYVVPMLDSRQSFLDLQALAAADPVTGEMSGAGERPRELAPPAVRHDPAPDPTPGSPSTLEPEASPTEADRSRVEGSGANDKDTSKPGDGGAPPPSDATAPPGVAADVPRPQPPGGPHRSRSAGRPPSSGRGSTAGRATTEAGQGAFDHPQTSDPGRFAR